MSSSSADNGASARRFPWGTLLVLAVLCGVAFVARAFHYRAAFPDGRFAPFEVDPFYRMHRVWMTLAHYPWVSPTFDYYVAYPLGAPLVWPPLLEFLVATLALAIGLGRPSVWVVEHTAALLPAVFGAATVLPVYGIARHFAGRACAPAAAAIWAVCPAAILMSMLGRLDHHVLEVFLSACYFLALLKALAGRRGMAWVAGGFLGLTFLTWQGAGLFVGITLCFYVVALIDGYRTGEDAGPLLRSVAPALLVALIAILPYARYPTWTGPGIVGSAPVEDPPLPYTGLSVFHVGFVFASLVFVCGGCLAARRLKQRAAPMWLFASALAGLAVLALGLLTALGLLGRLRIALEYVGGRDPWLSTISECQPLFSQAGRFGTCAAEVLFGYAIYLFPVAFVLMVVGLWRRGSQRRELLWFSVWTVLLFGLALCRRRFVGELSVCFSAVMAYAGVAIVGRVRRIERPSVRKGALIAAVCAMILLAFPAANYYAPLCNRWRRCAPRYQTAPPWYRTALDFLRERTPTTSHFEDPSKKPEYGVLAPWYCGEWVECIGRRPVLANCMGTHIGRAGPFRDAVRFLFLEEESDAVALLTRNEVRFVITAYLAKNLPQYCGIAGADLSRYAAEGERESRLVLTPTPRYFHTMGSRLHERDGTASRIPQTGEPVPALRRFRLIYEGARDPEFKVATDIASLKIFEFVEGATLSGRADPEDTVTASVSVSTNRGRTFRYVSSRRVDPSGRFEIVVPYSTTGCPYPTQAATAYRVASSTGAAMVEVPEEALGGGTVPCNLTGR